MANIGKKSVYNNIQKDTKPPVKNDLPLDTLAQLATSTEKDQDLDLISCTSIDDKKALIKRARRKYLGTGLALNLVTASEKNEHSYLKKGYFNTFHCASILNVHSTGKIVSKYCKNRWCMVCNAIRTAKLINQYQPVLNDWDDKYFVTLTIPNVDGLDLKNAISGMAYNFNRMRKRLSKRSERGSGGKIIGIRKFECTYNSKRNDYHPHYHLIVRGEDVARNIVDTWLDMNRTCKREAQDYRPADNKSSLELFKYFTKVISGKKNEERRIYADAMDVVFNAVKGKRVFQPMGFKMKKVEEGDPSPPDILDVPTVRRWVQEVGDWVDEDTGELLTGYRPSEGMKELVRKIIVRDAFRMTKNFK